MSRKKDIFAYCLFFLIGFVPFGPINALWAEVGFFEINPEGKGIGALIGAAYNIANIVPVLYLFLVKYKRISDLLTANVLYALAVADMVVCAFLWNWTPDFAGSRRSVGLALFSFISGVVGCTSNIVVFNFAARYQKVHITSLSAGMSLSGIFGALMALAQESNGSETLTFPVSAYFIIFACIMGLSFPSFWLVTRDRFVLDYGRSHGEEQKIKTEEVTPEYEEEDKMLGSINATVQNGQNLDVPLLESNDGNTSPHVIKLTLAEQFCGWLRLAKSTHRSLIPILISAFMNYFVLPGLIPYLVGNYSQRTVYVVISLSVANMLGRMICGHAYIRRLFHNPYYLALCQLICFIFLILVALFSSFASSLSGLSFVLTVCAVFSFLNGMIMTSSYLVLDHVEKGEHDLVVRWLGLVTQLGSLSGSFLVTALVGAGIFS